MSTVRIRLLSRSVWFGPHLTVYRVDTGDPRVRVFDSETSHVGVEFHGVCDKINICSVGWNALVYSTRQDRCH